MKINRVLIFLVTFVITMISLLTSTVAWITLPRIDTFDNIQFTVIKDATFEISFDGINYYEEVDSEILKQYLLDKMEASDFTSMDGINFTTIHDNNNLEYISFDVYFRADRSAASNIYLVDNMSNQVDYEYIQSHDIDGTYFVSEGYRWTPGITFDNGYGDIVDKNEPRIYYATNAFRMSVHEQNVSNTYLDKEDTRTNLASFIFDPSEDESRGFGKEFGAYDYYCKQQHLELEMPSEIPDTLYHLTKFDKDTETIDNNDSLVATMQLGKENGLIYKYAKITITMWFEGWDPDCIDGIGTDQISIQLKFMCADPA